MLPKTGLWLIYQYFFAKPKTDTIETRFCHTSYNTYYASATQTQYEVCVVAKLMHKLLMEN